MARSRPRPNRRRRATSGTKPSAPVELVRLIRGPTVDPGAGLVELTHVLATTEANLHGLETLAAVRRWQITHRALPGNLAAACRRPVSKPCRSTRSPGSR